MDPIDENGILDMLDELSQKSDFERIDEEQDLHNPDVDEDVVNPDTQNGKPNEIEIFTESSEVVIESHGVTVEELQEFLQLRNFEEVENRDEEVQPDFVDSVENSISEYSVNNVEVESDGILTLGLHNLEENENRSEDVGQYVVQIRSEEVGQDVVENRSEEVGQDVVENRSEEVFCQEVVENPILQLIDTNEVEVESDDIDNLPLQKRVRKKIPNPDNWKRNQRKRKHQAGEEYVNQKGKLVHKKQIETKKDCLQNCRFKCSQKITSEERESIFKGYYSLQTQFEKHLFLKSTTERTKPLRCKSENEVDHEKKRKFSFRYFFTVKSKKVQVCKTYFLSTLNISQKPVYNVHEKKDPETDFPKTDGRGKLKVSVIPEFAKNDVRNHIKSFPAVESHYCRKDTTKHYLDSSLSLSKMYSLFLEKHPDTVIKESMYRRIFVTEFNIDFHTPKSDRCEVCEEYTTCVKEGLPVNTEHYENHILQKDAMRAERNKDRDNLKKKEGVPVLCFDLQNVISCPRAEISPLFYYSKLSVYNITAHLKTCDAKRVYCAIWTEVTGGRSGNDIASAVYKILKRVLIDFPDINNLITWSDSCVPQNRNQMIVGAMMLLLKENPKLNSITMKYSTPGHGGVQEVDNVHSHIEKAMMVSEFYSPVGLIRILKNVNRKNPFTILQMTDNDFLDFAASSKPFCFQSIPFTRVSSLKVSQVVGEIYFNESHGEEMEVVNIKDFGSGKKNKRKTRGKSNEGCAEHIYEEPSKLRQVATLKPEKKRDITRMLKFMPVVDREYFHALLKAH